MQFPKSPPGLIATFADVIPASAEKKMMFGYPAAFVNGNMFMGLFGPDVFVRLSDADREAVAGEGGIPFEPMPGRPMREYVVLPAEWRSDPGRVQEWAARSLEWAEELPPKQPKR